MNEFTIRIPSIMENIRIVESFVDNARSKYNINDDMYGNIMIAVTESVTNAIVHGNDQNKNKNVYLTVEQLQEQIAFHIKDEGNGFDYMNLPNPTSPENLEKPGGRGIFLISNLCDKFSFEKNGSSIKLFFNLK